MKEAVLARKPIGVWTDIILTLALVTLATLVLNAGLLWLVMRQVQVDGRAALTQDLAVLMAAALSQEMPGETREEAYHRVLRGFEVGGQPLVELFVTNASLAPLAVEKGHPPESLDAGLREALFGRRCHLGVIGRFSRDARVTSTCPVPPVGPPIAALRVSMPLEGGALVDSGFGFVFMYLGMTGLVIGAAGFVVLRRRLLRPLDQLRQGTRRIASGDFDHRMAIDASSELQDLNADLNALAASLSEYRGQTGDHVRRLEETNQALARAQDDLIRSARLVSVGRLSAGIAHEVGNPLSAVVGYLDLLRQESGQSAFTTEILERAIGEVDRIHRIIRELLDYARPGTGVSVALDVLDLVAEVVTTLSYQPVFRRVEVRVIVDEGLPRVRVEPVRLRQVLMNLLLNAADAMEGKGVVEIGGTIAEGRVRITVRDSGPGFQPGVLQQLFEPFFTTKEPGHGIGLGLATSLAIVEGYQGTLRAENHPSGGALLTIELPAVVG